MSVTTYIYPIDGIERSICLFVTAYGKFPFEDWFRGIRDQRTQQRILARIGRVRLGNLGDWKAVGDGVFEMRLDFGGGYRIYFGQEGTRLVILLVGGTKGTQAKDIKSAKEYWHEYQENKESKDF